MKNQKIIQKFCQEYGRLESFLPSVLQYKNKGLKIILNKEITGVSQGQAIVLYQGTKCLGGGEIGEVNNHSEC